MSDAIGYAASDPSSTLKPIRFRCDEPGANDVLIDILYCGVCHSDIHQARNEWGNTVYPCLPGHEIVGRASRIGGAVTRVAVGDLVGVGCMIDSCGRCAACLDGAENYCEGPNSWLATYNGPMVPAARSPSRGNIYGRDNTFGGYATAIVVTERFVLRLPDALAPEAAAPILCAGVTTYAPMRHWGVGPGSAVGIIGFGGLGDMALRIAIALGATVTVFTNSPDKEADARRLGAARVVVGTGRAALAGLRNSFDFLLDTIPQAHELDAFVTLLKRDRTIVVVGALETMKPVNNVAVARFRRSVAGSLIGSIADTQEVLDFCARHGIAPAIELIAIADINEAYERITRGEVRYRHVIDMGTLTGRRGALPLEPHQRLGL